MRINLEEMLLKSVLGKQEITKEDLKELILNNEEVLNEYNQNALIAVLLHILIRSKLVTMPEIEKLKKKTLEELIDRDIESQLKEFSDGKEKND